MIPQPTPEDLALDADKEYAFWDYPVTSTRIHGWIRRAVAAERDRDGYAAAFREVQRLACSMADRIEAQSQLLSKRAEKPPEQGRTLATQCANSACRMTLTRKTGQYMPALCPGCGNELNWLDFFHTT